MKIDMVQLYVNDAIGRITSYARQILAAMESGEALNIQLQTLGNLSQFTPLNCVQLRRGIADEIIQVGKYTC
jgi:hypothetical protein